ncbi:TIGR04222 domain-containing membrane protein [Actinokineospora pegani]|uniref:TIGR04222 domain-containing membrane protein n=1 Tax=Actinokineospora pegani TaxID=2654637 RepID=UPI0012EA0BEB|nr:TIGR04222 domain-containing membrane protein [Actinokineospora pegani]
MGETWGIAGPDFLRGYAVALAFAALAWTAVRLIARSGPRGTCADAVPHSLLTLDELAYLAGGPRRLVEVSLARVLDAGLVRPSRAGRVRVVAGASTVHDVDSALLSDAGGYRYRTVGSLVDQVGRSAPVRDIGAALTRKGLLVDRGFWNGPGAALPFALLFAVGTARVAAGAAGGRPVAPLVLLLGVTAAVGVVLARRALPLRTHAGDRVLAEATAARVGDFGPGAALLGGVAGLVALGGLAAHPDAEVSSALEPVWQAASGTSWSPYSGGENPTGASCGGPASGGSRGGDGCGGGCGA